MKSRIEIRRVEEWLAKTRLKAGFAYGLLWPYNLGNPITYAKWKRIGRLARQAQELAMKAAQQAEANALRLRGRKAKKPVAEEKGKA